MIEKKILIGWTCAASFISGSLFTSTMAQDLQKLQTGKSTFSEAWGKWSGPGGVGEKVRPELKAQDIAALADKCTGRIHTTTSDNREITGTAFLIGKGLAVTNYHVIKATGKSVFQIKNGDFKSTDHNYKVLASDQKDDLAILGISDLNNSNYLALSNPHSIPRQLDDVYLLGNPENLDGSAATGKIGAFRMKAQVDSRKDGSLVSSLKDGWDCIQFSATTGHGGSGSALLNNRGEVIGVYFAIDSAAQITNYAVSVSRLRALLKTIGYTI